FPHLYLFFVLVDFRELPVHQGFFWTLFPAVDSVLRSLVNHSRAVPSAQWHTRNSSESVNKQGNEHLTPALCSPAGKCDQFKDFPFSRETGSPRQRHRRPPSVTSGPSQELRRGETQNQNDHHFQEGLPPHQELPFLPGAPADLVLQAGQGGQPGAVPEEAAQAGPEPQPHQAAAGHAGGPGVPAGAGPARQPPGGLQCSPVQLGPAEIPAAAGPEPEPDPGAAAGVLPAAGAGAAAAGRQRAAAPALPHRAAGPPALPVSRAQQAALPALRLQEALPGEPGSLWESFRAAQPAGAQHPAENPPDAAGVRCQGCCQPQSISSLSPGQISVAVKTLRRRQNTRRRIPYGCHLLPSHLCKDLEVAKTCLCGSACLSSFIQITVTMNLHHVAHTVVLVDNMGGTEAPVLCYFCSLDCYCQFLDRHLQSSG
uniref:Uncharacterized protein n=1 Tax=Ficedula albicollis TaxID=59894 RepID=A0A803VPU5_FICAL